jgi:hypothetical protein
MSAYNFKEQFVEPILSKAKLHTIRRLRRDGRKPRVGERFIAYYGLRSIHTRRLFESVITKVEIIRIDWHPDGLAIYVNRRLLNASATRALARRDGFAGVAEMRSFWIKQNGLSAENPFCGHIIHWSPDYLP